MNAVTPSRSRASVLSVALIAAAVGLTMTAFAGEETTWHDKWPAIQAQLSSHEAKPPPLRSKDPRIAEYSGAIRAVSVPVLQDPSPASFDDDAELFDTPGEPSADPHLASPYDAPSFDLNPG